MMKMKPNVRYLVLGVLLGLVWLTQLIPALATFYSQTVYPCFSYILSSFSNLFPFAIGDLFIFLSIAGIIIYPIYTRLRKKTPWKKILLRDGEYLLWVYVWFYLAWGLNYFRFPFYERTGIAKAAFSAEKFQDFPRDLCYNQAHPQRERRPHMSRKKRKRGRGRVLILVVLLALLVAALLASRLTHVFLAPITLLDLHDPLKNAAYDELSPLLEKISAQNRQIAAQMDELRRRQTEFTAITEHMNEGLLIVDARTNLLFCNPSARRLLQIENVEKQSVLAVNRSEDFREAVQRALSGEHDLRTLTLDGRIYQLMANPAMEDGRLAGAVLVLLDVTEREDREQLRREFTANVSHELRSPITAISGYVEGMRDGTIGQEDYPQYLTIVSDETTRLKNLIGDLLKLSRLEKDDAALNKTNFDICELLSRVLLHRTGDLEAKKMDVECDFAPEPCMVSADESRIEQVAVNLLDNAIKFTPDGGVIRMSVRVNNQGICTVIVQDNGVGISPEDRPHVFERFYTADKAHTSGKGTGLGLSICQRIMEMHGQKITLMDTGDEAGAAFAFTLDCAK